MWPLAAKKMPQIATEQMFYQLLLENLIVLHLRIFNICTDQIDENLKLSLQKELNFMAPGLTIQASFG